MLSSAIVFSFGLVGLRKLNLTGDFGGLLLLRDLHHFRGLYRAPQTRWMGWSKKWEKPYCISAKNHTGIWI
jgi:hypothetical protein